MQSNWKVLIVTNGKIIPEYYQNDQKFNKENWSFFNVGKERLEDERFDIVNSCDFKNYEYLGKDWAESEVIYNVYKLNLFSEYEYLGIIHWDFNLYAKDNDTYRITENIENILKKFKWISFFPGFYKHITGFYNVLLDERKPNCLFVRDSGLENPKSANDFSKSLIEEYGFKRNENNPSQEDLISLCCSFLTLREDFLRLGKLVEHCVKSKMFDMFDIEKRHRIPGQVMERLVSLYQMLTYGNNIFSFRLDHRFTGGIEINRNDPNGENY